MKTTIYKNAYNGCPESVRPYQLSLVCEMQKGLGALTIRKIFHKVGAATTEESYYLLYIKCPAGPL